MVLSSLTLRVDANGQFNLKLHANEDNAAAAKTKTKHNNNKQTNKENNKAIRQQTKQS